MSAPGCITALAKFGRASKAKAAAVFDSPAYHFPTLAIYGDKDPDFPSVQGEVTWIKDLLERRCSSSDNTTTAGTAIGSKHVHLFENVSHYPHVEQPERVVELIEDFLKQLK